MRRAVQHAIVGVGLVLALAPLSAFADQLSNQTNDDVQAANRAQQAWLETMTPLQQGVALRQMEIANANAMAKLMPGDPSASSKVPNAMEQYNAYCGMVTQKLAAKVANASAALAMRPWDDHAQAKLANATAQSMAGWSIIGDTYPGNPYASLAPAPATPVYAGPLADAPADDEAVAGDEAVAADDAATTGGEDDVAAAVDAGG